MVKSAHDCSEGGLAVALAESCFNPDGVLGANVDLGNCGSSRADGAGETPASTETVLFNESQSRIIISVAKKDVDLVLRSLKARNVPARKLGEVGGDTLQIRVHDENFEWPIVDLYDDWFHAIRRAVEGDASGERIPSL